MIVHWGGGSLFEKGIEAHGGVTQVFWECLLGAVLEKAVEEGEEVEGEEAIENSAVASFAADEHVGEEEEGFSVDASFFEVGFDAVAGTNRHGPCSFVGSFGFANFFD